jgi:AcrR family transcriptional regulator
MQAAMDQFVNRGIYATRIEDITETADVAKGAFYNYFDSKHDLIAALLSQGIELFETDYLNGITQEPSEVKRVRSLVENQETFWREHPEFALLFHQARGLLLLEPGESGLKNVFRNYLGCIARNLQAPGDRRRQSAKRIQRAAALAGLIAGYRSFAFAAGLQMDVQYAVQIAVSSVLISFDSPAAARRSGNRPA